MSTMFFKQSYKARASPSTPGLNVRHLQYIATRPGAVYNRGCGFGLWGRLPGAPEAGIQTNLEQAKKVVREASVEHTLYRAILSVGKEDAETYGLYHRERWEGLVQNHIGDIAREMNIKPENLCYCASFHCAKGHPHVHILYWDCGKDPQPEGIPKPLWEAKAERIRAAFAGDIHREKIQAAQKEQREQIQPLRIAIQALCREANPEKVLDMPRLYQGGRLDGLSRQLAELVEEIPAKGSLRYAYLPAAYRANVDALVDRCLEMPELRKEAEAYKRCSQEISRLYANGEAGSQKNSQKAWERLHRALCNEVMDAVREAQQEVRASAPSERDGLRELLREAAEAAPSLESYQTLKGMLPRERIPMESMERQIPGYHDQMNRVVGDVLQDARVRLRLQGYALKEAGIDLDTKKDAGHKRDADSKGKPEEAPNPAQPVSSDVPEKHRLFGKEVETGEWDAYREAYRDAKRALRDALTAQLRQEAGWTEEAVQTSTAMLLMGIMRLLSQATHQRQAERGYHQERRSRDKSREQRKNERAIRQFGSGWEPN